MMTRLTKHTLIEWGVVIGLLLCILLTSLSCTRKTNPDVIRVGVILNLTGQAAKVDSPKKRATELANQYLQKQAKEDNLKIELVFEDAMSTAKGSISAYNNLVRQGVKIFLVGSSLSAMPIGPINKASENLLFGVSGHPDFTSIGGRAIRCYPNVEQSANIIIEQLIDDSAQSVYILHMEEPWTKSYADVIRTRLENERKVLEDTYPVGSQDFRDIVARIKLANPDQILLLDYGISMQEIIKTLIENDVHKPIIGCETTYVANLPSVKGFELENFVFLATEYTERVVAGKDEFANYYGSLENGSQPPYYAVFCADALAILSDILKENKELTGDPKTLYKAILAKKHFSAFSGSLEVKASGDINYPIKTYRFTGGQPVRIQINK